MVVTPLAVGVVLGFLCWWAAGESLGLFLGGLGMVAIAGPSMAVREQGWMRRLVAMGCVVDGIAIAWLGHAKVWEWMQCYLVLAAFGAFLLGLIELCYRVGLRETVAAAVAVVTGTVWLTWPVWAAKAIEGERGQSVARALIAVSPTFAINHAVREMGIWSERPIAYRVMNLNQTVAYQLPTSVWPCVALHIAIGGALLLVSRRRKSRRGDVDFAVDNPDASQGEK